MRAKLAGELLLGSITRDSNDAVAHLVGKLDGQVAQTAEALDGDSLTGSDVHVAEGVEDGDTGAENGGILCSGDVGRDADSRFLVKEAILCICNDINQMNTVSKNSRGRGRRRLTSAVLGLAIDDAGVAHLEPALLAGVAGSFSLSVIQVQAGIVSSAGARTIVSSVPAASNTLTDGPTRDIVSNGSYMADNLMARDNGTVQLLVGPSRCY